MSDILDPGNIGDMDSGETPSEEMSAFNTPALTEMGQDNQMQLGYDV
jgi:hypothetical protein